LQSGGDGAGSRLDEVVEQAAGRVATVLVEVGEVFADCPAQRLLPRGDELEGCVGLSSPPSCFPQPPA
jgi:hypothetical protein